MNENGAQTLTPPDSSAVKPFSASRNDLSQLGQVALEATKDVKDRVAVHAGRAKQHLTSLVGNARHESGAHLDEIKEKAAKVHGHALDVVKQRPLVSIGIALAIGVILASVLRLGKNSTK